MYLVMLIFEPSIRIGVVIVIHASIVYICRYKIESIVNTKVVELLSKRMSRFGQQSIYNVVRHLPEEYM